MGEITKAFGSTFRDFTMEGVAGSGRNDPNKAALRALGPLIENAIVQGRVPYASWAELAAIVGVNGHGAEVIVSAVGTHVDPITAANVPDAGVYRYVTGAPAGWKRIGDNISVVIATNAASAEGAEDGTAVSPEGLAFAQLETYGLVLDPLAVGGNLPDGMPQFNGSWLVAPAAVSEAERDELTHVGVSHVAEVPDGAAAFFQVAHSVPPQVGDYVIASVVLEKSPTAAWPADGTDIVMVGNIPISGAQQSMGPSKGELLRYEVLGDHLRRYVLRGKLGETLFGTVVSAPLTHSFIGVINSTGEVLKASAYALAASARMPFDLRWRDFDRLRSAEFGERLNQLDGGAVLQTTPGLLAPPDYFLVDDRPLWLRKAGMTEYREGSAFDLAAAGPHGDLDSGVIWDDGRQIVLDPARLAGAGALFARRSRSDVGQVFRRPVTWHRAPGAAVGSPRLLFIGDSLGWRGWVGMTAEKTIAAGLTPELVGTFKEIGGEWSECRSSWSTRSFTYGQRAVNVDGTGQIYPVRTGAGAGVAFAVTRVDGVITEITAAGGVGYSNHDAIPLVITGGGGSGAFATVAVAGGVPGAVTIVNGGTGYAGAPAVAMPPTVAEYNLLNSAVSAGGPRWQFNPFIRPATGGDNPAIVGNRYVFDLDFYLSRFGIADPDRVYIALGVNDVLRGFATADSITAIGILYAQVRAALPGADIVFCLYGLSAQGGTGWGGCVKLILAVLEQQIAWIAGGDANVFVLPFYQAGEMKLGYDSFGAPASTNEVGVETGSVGDGIHPVDQGFVHAQWAEMAFALEMCRA